jgi:hypothetical protein
MAETAAQQMAASAGATVTLFPSAKPVGGGPTLALPVTPESRLVFPLKSQMVRAAAPWLKFWRKPVRDFGYLTLQLSQFSSYYKYRTDEFLLTKVYEMKALGVNLFVMQDTFTLKNGYGAVSDKGHEPWTTAEGSKRADQLFGILAIARRDPAPATKVSVFRPTNPGGIVAYSQAMLYNANPQKTPLLWWQVPQAAAQGVQNWLAPLPNSTDQFDQLFPQLLAGWEGLASLLNQPEVGWDTLNWDGAVPEANNPALYLNSTTKQLSGYLGMISGSPLPMVRLNWQAKLVPTTRLRESAPYQQGGPLPTILERFGTGLRTLDNTH